MLNATLTERDVAGARWQEAGRVKDAFGSQVVKRRAAWRAAPAGKEADKARRNLKNALEQLAAAEQAENAAWRAYHALGKDG